jgi:hypothetical protein
MVESTTKDDRIALVRWMFAAASAHPAVASLTNGVPQQLDDANKTLGALVTRLLTDSCKDKAKKALSYEGPAAFRASFEVLGRIAGTELFSSPEVTHAMTGLEKYLDKKKLSELKD